MLLENLTPQIKNIIVILLDNTSQLTVPIAQQAPIINISRPNNTSPVIYNHQFGVNVDDLSLRPVSDNLAISETEEMNVILGVYVVSGESGEQGGFFVAEDCLELMVNLDAEDCACWVCDISLKSWQQWHDHDNFESPIIILSSLDNSVSQAFDNFILQAHKKLILNINEILRLLNQSLIGLMYGRLVLTLPNPNTPLRSTSTHLQLLTAYNFARFCFDEKLRESFLSAIYHVFHFLGECGYLLSFVYLGEVVIADLFVAFIRGVVEGLLISLFQKIEGFHWVDQQLRFDKVPILHEMPEQIQDNISSILQSNIMPRHPHLKILIQIRLFIIPRLSNILCSIIIVISPIPQQSRILQRMVVVIPSTIADIQPSHKPDALIDNHHFFVVAPEERDRAVWMSVDFYVVVERLEVSLDELRIIVDYQFWLHKHDDVHFYASFSQRLKHTIQSTLLVVNRIRPFQQKIRRDHPTCYTYLFLCVLQFIEQIFIIFSPVAVQFCRTVLAFRAIATKSMVIIRV